MRRQYEEDRSEYDSLSPYQGWLVHLLWNVRELKQKYPMLGVLDWAKDLRDLYDRAMAISSGCGKACLLSRLRFRAELLELAVPPVLK